MQPNWARLNHVLIPSTKSGRDRFRRGRWAWVGRGLAASYRAFTTEGRVGVGLWFLSGVMGLQVEATQIYLLWSALSGILLASLAVRLGARPAHLDVRVECPNRVRMGQPLTLTLVVTNQGRDDVGTVRVEGPFLPWDGRYVGPQPAVAHIAAGQSARLTMQASFIERGEHQLDPFYASVVLPMGLCATGATASPSARFVVLPRQAAVRRLELPRAPRHHPGGVAQAASTGESRDLIGLRAYRPGDPVRDLHARTWARVGFPVLREYRQEYFSRVAVVLDGSTRRKRPALLEASVCLTAGVLAQLATSEALIDLLALGGRVHTLTLGRSLGRLEQALVLLADVRPSKPNARAPLLPQLGAHLPRLSSVVFVAADWNAENQDTAARIRQHGVGCTVLLVGEPGARAQAWPGVREIPRDRIDTGANLWL